MVISDYTRKVHILHMPLQMYMHAYSSVLFVGKLKIDLPEIKEKSRRKELQERLDTREKLGEYIFTPRCLL